MKQPFVNATLNDRRKGKEVHAQTAQSHPARPTSVSSPDAHLHPWAIPVRVAPAPPPKVEPASDLEAMKAELLKAMRAVDKKPKVVPKNKLIGMANSSATEEHVRDYNDILSMLLAKK